MYKTLVLIVALLFLAAIPERTCSQEILEASDFPSLVSSIRISNNLDFCGESLPSDNQEVLERLEKELLLTLADRPQVILWLKRSHRYLPYIEKMLKENNMPEDLKYVAIVESALRPHVSSPKGAIGFWQFMESTGRIFGLTINNSVDERRNIFKSTLAAIHYFKGLHDKLGSWTLAAAAFNMGEEGLKAEILVQKTENYYHLYLPLETQRYIFRIISAKLILSEPEKYGFRLRLDDLYPPLKFDRVEIECEQKIPIYVIARAAGTYFKKIKDLNPEIRGHFFSKGQHSILIPEGAAIDFQARYEKSLNDWLATHNEQFYIVKEGDHLSMIAERFKVPLPALLIWNNLDPKKPIHPGERLIIYSPENISDEMKVDRLKDEEIRDYEK